MKQPLYLLITLIILAIFLIESRIELDKKDRQINRCTEITREAIQVAKEWEVNSKRWEAIANRFEKIEWENRNLLQNSH